MAIMSTAKCPELSSCPLSILMGSIWSWEKETIDWAATENCPELTRLRYISGAFNYPNWDQLNSHYSKMCMHFIHEKHLHVYILNFCLGSSADTSHPI